MNFSRQEQEDQRIRDLETEVAGLKQQVIELTKQKYGWQYMAMDLKKK